jgi:hypothetical protein
MDSYTNTTGFPGGCGSNSYNTVIASPPTNQSPGLKMTLTKSKTWLKFRFAVNEQCFEYNECNPLSTFVDAGKAVFNIEYNLDTHNSVLRPTQVISMLKRMKLDAWVKACRQPLGPDSVPRYTLPAGIGGNGNLVALAVLGKT